MYMGGKSRIASKIREHLISHGATRYVEPFVGGGAVLTAVAGDFAEITANDAHEDLIDLYRALQAGWVPPEVVTEEEFNALRSADPSPLRTFAGFCCSYGGAWWAGYARNKRGDNYARQGRNSLERSRKRGAFGDHVRFTSASVFDLDLPADLTGTVIYADPPYAGTSGYSVGEFDAEAGWDLYRAWAARGAHVYVSEYTGPEENLVAEYTPQASMGPEQTGRVRERLFYLPPAVEQAPADEPALWYRATNDAAGGAGYTSNIDMADPADVRRKHTARDWVRSGRCADLQAALYLYDHPEKETDTMTTPFADPAGDTDDGPPWVEEPFLKTETVEFQADPPDPAAEPENVPWSLPEPKRPPVAEVMAEVLADADPPLTLEVGARYVPPSNPDAMPPGQVPNVHPLPRIDVPDASAYYPHISAWLATGEPARAAVDSLPVGAVVAVDTETMGLGADSFTLKCFTAAWETPNGTVSILLDPTRRGDDRRAVREILTRAGTIVIQNAAYDVPPLHQNGLLELADIAKVHDTVVYARMAYPDRSVSKSLEALSVRLVGFPEAEITMAALFKASGLTVAEGFKAFDIDRPVYRLGAMADTVATLRLLQAIQAAAWSRLAEGHPFDEFGLDSAGAVAVMEREQEVNRIMLRRSARGLAVDTDYLNRYEEEHARELTAARDALAAEDLDPDAGNLGYLLVSKLDARGELPASWPRTDSGRLRATKDDLPKLDHPLAASARKVAELGKVTGYLTKVSDMVRVTGRVHPQVGVLGASATGRMAYSWPELQQFPADARPIIVSPTGLTSVDWSQIEPVVMANCARDVAFLEPFENGADLYAPIQAAAGVPRKTAKVLLLAAMYGQGKTKLAESLGISTEEAKRLQAGMFSAMPSTRAFIDRLRQIGEDTGLILSADGRVLPVPSDPRTGAVFAYKAVNYFCQGSAYSVLADTIVRLERAGLGDSIHLALHDELVVDTEAAEAVAEIMRTPPEFLLKWTGGRPPVFKTDTADMGTAWAYV